MTVATASYSTLPHIADCTPIAHLQSFLDKPVIVIVSHNDITWQIFHAALNMELRYTDTKILPSHKTSLNTARYRANEGWISLGIEQANLRNIDTRKSHPLI